MIYATVRIRHWTANGALHASKSITFSKRRSDGRNLLAELAEDESPEIAWSAILNIDDVSEGLYRVDNTGAGVFVLTKLSEKRNARI